ncbi:immunoglobulin-like domain-containing protein [Mucilaginibacter pocheonensis]|uniref:Pesticidal crystal protein Cry22Aa Ig-like domain-containing protein n=1 Tax=Mucilaginibacter pocheonensis TaxID=398050 RepID=A0ABU1TGR5_9SPHI|nr:immunoglobulin-like domain-containing protein [Mucilaginibacter pocheonensis]MDR6944552.1 hypothetical protein [Mucilaginibacter pocheonensis]
MKRYINYLAILTISSILLTACNKDNFNYKAGYVGQSKITNYAVFTVKGATAVSGVNYTAVAKGSAYTEPGVEAKAGSATLKVTTKGTVNTSTPGVYVISYSATNSDGFDATAQRFVVVYSTDATAASNNFSGNYARNTNGSIAAWTKLAPGVYAVNNPGGAPGTNLTVVVFNNTGNKVFIPEQVSSDGSVTSSDNESTVAGPGGTLTQYSMKIVNPGYGTSVRTFIKQ